MGQIERGSMPTVSQHYGRRRDGAAASAAGADGGAGAPVLLMVSGGADSTALLLMACTGKLDIMDGRGLARIARERISVLHVNHHLRGAESDGDEAFVRALCERLGVPLCVEHASFEELNGQNLEAAAREVRYAAARRLVHELSKRAGTPRSSARILTAHTASDRAETFLMNALRGSGSAGLASIPRRRNIVVRPLLDKTHDELVRYLEVAGEEWREDSTNSDTSYLRNYVRHEVMPTLVARNAHAAQSIGSACDILGDEDAFLSQLAATALRTCIRRQERGLIVLDAKRLAAAEVVIARRMVRLALKQLAPDIRLEMRHVEAVLALVAAQEGSVTLPERIDARVEFGALAFRTSDTREGAVAGWLQVPGRMNVAGGAAIMAEAFMLEAGADPIELARAAAAEDEPALLLDAAALGYAERDLVRLTENGNAGALPAEMRAARLWVDGPAAGDIMCPFGMSGRTKKVSDLLNEARVPLAERAGVPVVRTAPGGAVVWLAGVRSDERFRCTASTRAVIRLVLHKLA